MSSRRPALERRRLITRLTPAEAVGLLRARSDASAALIRSLTDAKLSLATKPPRSCGETLAATIERVMIGHYDTHRAAIKAKATDAPDAASA